MHRFRQCGGDMTGVLRSLNRILNKFVLFCSNISWTRNIIDFLAIRQSVSKSYCIVYGIHTVSSVRHELILKVHFAS